MNRHACAVAVLIGAFLASVSSSFAQAPDPDAPPVPVAAPYGNTPPVFAPTPWSSAPSGLVPTPDAGMSLGFEGAIEAECVSRVEVATDYLLLSRGKAPSRGLIYNPATDAAVLGTSDLGFDAESGWRIKTAYDYDPFHGLRFEYFHIDNGTSATVTGSSPYRQFRAPGRVQGSNRFVVDYGSQLDSWEFYGEELLDNWFTVQLGMRIVDFDDDLTVISGNRDWDNNFVYGAENHLYGFHFGSRIRLLDRGGPLRIHCIVKGAVFFNRIETNATVWPGTEPTTPDQRIRDREDHGTFMEEIGLVAEYRIGEWLSLRGGYQLIWLEGVALAPDQIPVNNFTTGRALLDSGGSLLYHGAFAGLTLRF